MPDRPRGFWLDSLLLFALTAYLIWPWLTLEYLDSWGSIESTFIGDARMLRERLPHPGWQPYWYCGTRFDYIYPPALRYGTALLSLALEVSTARAYHIYTGVLYCLGIAGVYLFVRLTTGSRGWAWVSALASTIVTPAYLFDNHFYRDYLEVRLMPLRLGVLVRWGEGPHMSAFALIPPALAAAWFGLRRCHTQALALAAVLSAAVVSNNFYGATALALLYPILVWSVWLAERDGHVWARAAAIAVLAYGLTAFWLTPSYLKYTLRNLGLVAAPGHAWSWWLEAAVLGAFAAITWRWARGRPGAAWNVFIAGSVIRLALHALGNYYFDFRTLGEPQRLYPEFDLFFILGGVAVLRWLWSQGLLPRLATIAILVLVLLPFKGWVRRSWQFFPAYPDHTRRVEYQVTRWLHQNLPESRIMVVGSVRFWYNAWFDLYELGGGSEQGTINLNSAVSYNVVAAGGDTDHAILWLQAMGVDAVAVPDERSAEIYHDFVNPRMFEGKLDVLHDDGQGNRVYRVPRRFPGLARVVRKDRLRPIRRLDGAGNGEIVRAYAEAVEQDSPRAAQWHRETWERVRVRARLEPGELLVIQETYDPAWVATAAGQRVPMERDPLDFQVLDPGPGDHEILLEFTTPIENRVGQALTSATLLGVLALLARKARK
jgi:hypothetical protein